MQFRIYDRQTLAYKDGGYVASYTIDDDYIVNNNSTITIVKALNDKVVEGDTIVLIKTSGAYHKGTITTFDNSDYKITYKSDKELFNNNILNPMRTDFIEEVEEGDRIYTPFGIQYIADIISSYFGNADDIYRKLPLKVYTDGDVLGIHHTTELVENTEGKTSGVIVTKFDEKKYIKKVVDNKDNTFIYTLDNGWQLNGTSVSLKDYGIEIGNEPFDGDKIILKEAPKMAWTWEDNQINFIDWLVDIFEKYNVVLSWDIDFDIAGKISTKLNDKEGDKDYGKIEVDRNGNIIVETKRNPYYIVRLSALSNNPKIIKANVNEVMQMITYTERQLPEATVCSIIDKESKEIAKLCAGGNLLNPQLSQTNKFLSIDDYNSIQETDDKYSNISGYISVEEDTTYTFSCKGYDGKTRYIVPYDKDKQGGIGQVPYNFGSIDERGRIGVVVPKDSGIKYIRVCYNNDISTELQFEKGSIALDDIKYMPYDQLAIYYLYDKDGQYYVSLNQDEREVVGEGDNFYSKPLRVLPVKNKIVEYDMSSEKTTIEQTAKDTLIPSKFNQAIEVQLSSDSKMFDFNSKFGDYYKIINENGTIDSVFTGRKETSDDKWVKLYFGLGRQNYTDLMQMRLRKNKYKVVYNQAENGK